MSPVRHVVIPQVSKPENLNAPLNPQAGGGMTRRGVVGRALATGVGAALAASRAPVVAVAQDATSVADGSDGELVGRMYMEELFNPSGLPPGGPIARQLPISGVR